MLNSPQTTESKLRSISGLSAFEFKDETIIRANFSEGIIRYSQSFLYLLRISHKDNGDPGYKYVDENVVAVLGYRNNILYIICVKDKTNGAAFESLCEEIVEVTNTPLIIKKMPSHVEFTMSPSKLNLAKSYLEDDTFPETLIRLKKLFTIDGLVNAKAARFIKKIKRFEKLKINYKIHYNLLDFDKEKVMNFFSMDNS